MPPIRWVDPPSDEQPRLLVPERPPCPRPVVLTPSRTAAAHRTIKSWPGYEPGPLVHLAPLTAKLGLGGIWLKDETRRFGVGSFKALGAGYALSCVLSACLSRAHQSEILVTDLLSGSHRDLTASRVAVAATDGNHGRALAWASRELGCQCVIYVPPQVCAARRNAIKAVGAEVIEVDGTYDRAVEWAAEAAVRNRWIEISDTAHGGDDEVPRLVMEGYTTLVEETAAALPQGLEITHLFVQAGVGGLAGAVLDASTSHRMLRNAAGIVVESTRAGCLLESVGAKTLTGVRGSLETIMAGLACGIPSTLALEIVEQRAQAFLQIPDDEAHAALSMLAEGRLGTDVPRIGPTGIAGLAGLLAVSRRPDWRAALGLDMKSQVLLIATEGVIDSDFGGPDFARR